ncbi:hypothetical protein [Kitasatospora sp. NPDC059327]
MASLLSAAADTDGYGRQVTASLLLALDGALRGLIQRLEGGSDRR